VSSAAAGPQVEPKIAAATMRKVIADRVGTLKTR
jgi:hypothetical protein